MTLLDVVLVILIVAATVRGLQAGFARQLFSLGCVLLGLLLGAWIAPWTSGFVQSDRAKMIVTLLTIFGVATAIGAVGEALGRRAGDALRRIHLGGLDATLGAAFGATATLAFIWLVSGMLASAPIGNLGQYIQESRVIRAIDARLPPSPPVIARIARFLDPLGFPRAFAGLEPDPGPPVALPGTDALQTAIQATSPSTLKVEATGCGGLLTGSGFVAAPGYVVTNAHVIAGTRDIVVIDHGAAHRAEPVTFDPETDVAVLRVDRLDEAPLALDTDDLGRGTGGAVLGYPGGGSLTIGPAAVLQSYEAEGRDIYNHNLTTRDIYVLQARVRPGSSGGPFVTPDGRVAGLVFARSISDGNVGYALRAGELVDDVTKAQTLQEPVSTGACAAD